ncbi:hypothetical protein ACWDA3_22230 [Nonomuraea rubra]
MDAAVRELAEETGIGPSQVVPASQTLVYIEYGRVPARPEKGEPETARERDRRTCTGVAFTCHSLGSSVPPLGTWMTIRVMLSGPP